MLGSDELAGWIGSFSQYKGKSAGADLQKWLILHDGGSLLVDRKRPSGEDVDDRTICVPRASVSVCGGIQPGVLKRALANSEFLDSGLVARVLFGWPPRRRKTWTATDISDETLDCYRRLIIRLIRLQPDTQLPSGNSVPHRLHLSDEAMSCWVEFFNSWACRIFEAEGHRASQLSKLEAAAARLAMVHHVVEHVGTDEDDRCPIGLASMEAGIRLAKWFSTEAERVLGLADETDAERDTRRLIDLIRRRGGRITTRQLMRANCRAYPDSDTAHAALARLVSMGLARWVEAEDGTPTRTAELCMTHDTHDTHDSDDDDLHDTDRESA